MVAAWQGKLQKSRTCSVTSSSANISVGSSHRVSPNFSMASTLQQISRNKCFGGYQSVYSHDSAELKCQMKFGVYVPPNVENQKLPVLYWLSGLSCTEENFIIKAGAQKYASEHNILIVNPDTSPRGCNIEGEEDSYDFGTGAGFYVDATEEKWKNNYRMQSYVTKELPRVIKANFNVSDKKSIFGHSMGGHGALVSGLKNAGLYESVSAFAPISNPMLGAWGQKALNGYLGPDKSSWKEYDATELVKNYKGPHLNILIDTGTEDNFWKDKQLLPENFAEAASGNSNVEVSLRMQEGYDHGYFFVSTFMADHIKFHSKFLK